MSEVAVTDAHELIGPDGSIIDLRDPGSCALALDDMQRLKAMVRDLEGQLKQALVEHSATIGKKTFEVSGVGKVEIKGDTVKKIDPLGLATDLRAAGCPEDRISEIIRETIEYKVVAVEANRAAKANPDYAAAVEANTVIEEKNPTVTVHRIGGAKRRPPASRPEGIEDSPSASDPADVSDDAMPWE